MTHPQKSLLLLSAIFSLAIATASAQTNPADPIIDAALANSRANSVNTYKFTYDEEWQTLDNDMSKAFPVTHTTEYTVSYIGTVPFHRKISIDRYPLDGPSVAKEDARYQAEVARINALPPTDRMRLPEDPTGLTFDPVLLKGYYTCNLTGEKKIDKRPTTVVDCKRRPEITIAPDSKAFLPAVFTFWIDKEKPFFNRTHILFAEDSGPYGKGTEVLIQYNFIDGVWQHTSTRIDFKDSKDSVFGGVIIDSFSHFKKVTDEGTYAPGLKFIVPLPHPKPVPDKNAPGSGRSR